MELYQVTYQLSMLVAAAVMLGLAVYAWQQRTAGGRRTFALLAAVLAIRMAASSFALSGSNYLLISDIRYLCDAVVPVLWFIFVVLYLGHRRVADAPGSDPAVGYPVLTLALVVTNPWHGLVWTAVTLTPNAPITVLVKSPGPWFWAHGVSQSC